MVVWSSYHLIAKEVRSSNLGTSRLNILPTNPAFQNFFFSRMTSHNIENFVRKKKPPAEDQSRREKSESDLVFKNKICGGPKCVWNY
jgi:hypothetical protein